MALFGAGEAGAVGEVFNSYKGISSLELYIRP